MTQSNINGYSKMGYLIYIAITSIQFLGVLATQPVIPLKCFLQDHKIFHIFGKSSVQTSQQVKNLTQIDNLKADTVKLDKDGFVFDTKNVEYLGLDKAILDDFGLNFIYKVSKVTFHTDVLVRCPYKANGTLFSKPIYGEGFIEVFIKNIQFSLTMPFEIVESNDNKFIELKDFFYWYDTKDYVQFKLDNLYNGDKEQSDTMHYLMNENWKYMVTNFGDIYMDKIADKVFNIFKSYMFNVPLKGIDNC